MKDKESDRKFAVIHKNLTWATQNENMIEQYKLQSKTLTVLPYDFYWNMEKDEMTTKHNELMYAKVQGWVDGYKFKNISK